VVGTIVGLAAGTRTGTIRSQEGSRLTFSAACVLGEFEALAVGHRVNFEFDRAQPGHSVVRVFHEPVAPRGTEHKLGAQPDLRYAGFQQVNGIRSYGFDAVASGDRLQRFTVRVDMTVLLNSRVGVQDVPALCLRKLAADLQAVPACGSHELTNEDLRAYASSRATTTGRKRARRPFVGRRGPPPPGPSGRSSIS
jgi:hypothetical protein